MDIVSVIGSATTVVSFVAFVCVVVWAYSGRRKRAFDDAAVGYDVVIGGIQTSALTSVLSTVFHVDQPIDTVPIEALKALQLCGRLA